MQLESKINSLKEKVREAWQKKKLILKVALNKDIASLVESYILIGIY